MEFEGKMVIVTGGTRGIGYATARAFKEQGATVAIFGSRDETVTKALVWLKEDTGEPSIGCHPDLANFDEVKETVEGLAKRHGGIDILINNAGIAASGSIEDTTPEEFERIVRLNETGVFNMCKAVVPLMKKQGSGVILNTSSMVSFLGQPSGVGYPMSKCAVNGLTLSLARELAPFNIRVNAVAPGVINTDMVAGLPDEMTEALVRSIPLGRIGEPEDIANAFLFLASEKASYITGQVLRVDGLARN